MNRRSETIEALLARARGGDLAALDELVSLLRPDVEMHVRCLLNRYRSYKVRCEPEDVTHIVWEDFLANYQKFETGDFELWFARRRRNRVLDQIRKEVRTHDNLDSFFLNQSSAKTETRGPEFRLETRELLEKVELLSPRQRAVITLYHGKGWTFQEIGDLLEIRATSVGTLHARALKRLKKLLSR